MDRLKSSGHHMYKNRLQEFTQKSGLPLPYYSSTNEAESHVPKFRATVIVDGKSITSPSTFFHRKDSEQDVAKLALEWLSLNTKNEGSYYIHKNPFFCKLILNEYGAKLKIEKPAYNTIQQNEILPNFITTVTFDGKTYTGFGEKSKKEAEQNAACIVIDSILASSNAGYVMSQIIKTKSKLYSAIDNGHNVGSAARRSVSESDGANNVDRGSKLEAIPTNVVDSQAVMNRFRIKYKRRSQREEGAEQPSTSLNPVKCEPKD